MKLSEWAKKVGISYKTAWRWFRDEKLPVKAIQTSTGTILVEEEKFKSDEVVIYARVSSNDQKSDLSRQIARLTEYATNKGFKVGKVVTEIGSGLNGHRQKLLNILRDSKVKTIIVEHKDRLMRFGFEYVENALASFGRNIIVVDNSEMKDDLVQDMIDVLTSFCARLYGGRSAKNKAKKAMEAISESK